MLLCYLFFFQAFVHQGTKFSGRPQLEVFNQYAEGKGIVVLDYGEIWKTQRKFGLMTLRGYVNIADTKTIIPFD